MARAREFLEAEMASGHMRTTDARLVLLSTYSTVLGVATEVEVLRAVGIEPTLAVDGGAPPRAAALPALGAGGRGVPGRRLRSRGGDRPVDISRPRRCRLTGMTARAIVLDPLMSPSDAAAMVALCEEFPGYGLYVTETSDAEFAPELAQRYDAAVNYVRTGGRFGRRESAATLALRTNYLRESYAYSQEVLAPGIERFLHHEALMDAAQRLYDERPVIEPAIAYANILLPGQELAVHTDVPEFRGANRKLFPQWLMVVMHHSGLFEPWRMPIATGVSYFADESAGVPRGGELAYWPEGAEGPVSVLPNRHNTGIVLDTDSVFHGVDRVGPEGADPYPVRPGNVLVFDAGRWVLHPDRVDDAVLASFGWDEIRFSISWKAYCFVDEAERDAWRTHADDLTLEAILGELVVDLRRRGALTGDEPGERELAELLIDTYERYPAPTPV